MKTEDAPTSAKPWLEKIKKAEKAFEVYQEKCDNIDKLYSDLESLSKNSGDSEFQIFWANLEVVKPSIYQRPPRPVVMPRHSDLGDVVRVGSEMVERALEFDVEDDDLHQTLCMVRDDLAVSARGVPWVLDNGQCLHVDRRDFLHAPSRKWTEVPWVARAVYLTKDEGRDEFGDIFKGVQVAKIGDQRTDDYRETEDKAKVWEIWCKDSRAIYYVVEGVDEILRTAEPYINVKGFFPCPRPAYGTLQRSTLLPVPDFVYYRDQVDEINTLTRRITSLAESLRLKGFYAGGTSEVGEAIETAMAQTSDKAILVPISNFAALGTTNLKDGIVWMPVREVGELIVNLVALRKQLIEDVYEITGLSDIMRGSTEAAETATAQNLKAQYGSVRVRERQQEMVRVAVDILRIKAEIFCETMSGAEIAQMAAMRLPTEAQVQAQMMQMPPEQQQGMKMPVTIEQVDQLLKSQSIRPFLMEVESDSTIAPDEQAEKQSRMEFLQAIGGFMQQAAPAVAEQPEMAPFLGELMKFTAGGFRAGRDLGGAIDDFVEQMKAQAVQASQGQQQPSPEVMKVQAEAQHKKAEMQFRVQEARTRAQLDMAKLQIDAKKAEIAEGDLILKEAQAEVDTLMRIEEADLERQQARPVAIG